MYNMFVPISNRYFYTFILIVIYTVLNYTFYAKGMRLNCDLQYVGMLWFNFILGLNLIFLLFLVMVKCIFMSLKQRKIKFKPKIKLNHNRYTIIV